jgi:hypothetical protein
MQTTLTDLITAVVTVETRKIRAAEDAAEADRAQRRAATAADFLERLEARFGTAFLEATGRELFVSDQGGDVALTFEHGGRRFELRNPRGEVSRWQIAEPDHRNAVEFAEGDQVPHRVLLYVAALTDQAGAIRDALMSEFFD